MQKVTFDSEVQPEVPQTPVSPPPPQVDGVVQLPQLEMLREVPQLSADVVGPQVTPFRAQRAASVSGVQPASDDPPSVVEMPRGTQRSSTQRWVGRQPWSV